jgi:hypothetical protein
MAAVFKRPLALALASALLACAPTAALAQSAGDQQYEDPLPPGGGDPSGDGGGETPAPAPSPSPAPAPAPAPSGSAPVGPSGATPAPVAGTGTASGTLPHTGVDPLPLLLLGSAMLLGGLGVRRLVARSEG